MDNLTKNLKRMAEREKTSFQKIVEIISKAIEATYEKNRQSGDHTTAKVTFDGDIFVVNNGTSTFELKESEFDKKFSYDCAEEIKKSLEEFRKHKEYEHFLPLKNKVVTGNLQSINEDGKYCIVNLSNGLGYWERKEWKKENLIRKIHVGSFLRFVILDVKMLERSTQVIISRNGEGFVKKVFQLEVPEINQGLVEIEKIIRVEGVVSKVILKAGFERNINPISACIGRERIRIRSVLKELGKERVDLVLWSENTRKMLINLLSPAEVVSVIQKSEQEWEVIVPEHKVSLILQSSGKVLQGIEDYLGIRINIRNFDSINEEEEVIIWNGNVKFNDFEAGKKINFKKNLKAQKES